MKQFIANVLWRIARISPKMGNRVMDFVGYDNYCKIAKTQTIARKKNRDF